MSEKDTRTMKYMRNNDRFEDILNFLICDGEQVIKAENIEPNSTMLTAHLYVRKSKSVEREPFWIMPHTFWSEYR